MPLTLEALPAREGDCLLLRWGEGGAEGLVLIDGGPAGVYDESLRGRLAEIGDGGPVVIDVAIVSHIDADHITGMVKFFQELKDHHEANFDPAEALAQVQRLWHNSFDDILGNSETIAPATAALSALAASNGEVNAGLEDDIFNALNKRNMGAPGDRPALAHDLSLVLASQKQGRDLRVLHRYLQDLRLSQRRNAPITENELPITVSAPVTEVKGLSFRVLGPKQAELEALQEEFDAYLEQSGLGAEAALAAYSDKSIPNLSSIVLLVEFDGKSILLTGDARGDKIIEALRDAEILTADSVKFNVLKVQHHGSDRNATQAFFNTVKADHYVLSGDGKHGNPERDTLEWLVASRGKAEDYKIHLTYPVPDIDRKRRAEFDRRNPGAWKPSEHSLAKFFEEKAASGFKFELLDGKALSGGAIVELG